MPWIATRNSQKLGILHSWPYIVSDSSVCYQWAGFQMMTWEKSLQVVDHQFSPEQTDFIQNMHLKLFPGQKYLMLRYTGRSPSNTTRVQNASYPEDCGSLGSTFPWSFALGVLLWLLMPKCFMCCRCLCMVQLWEKNCGPTPWYWGEQPCTKTKKDHAIILTCNVCTAPMLRLTKLFIRMVFPTNRCLWRSRGTSWEFILIIINY